MIVTSEPLEEVRSLRHIDENPPTSTDEGLDFERCSALHNAIVKHAWVSFGFDLASMPKKTVWSLDNTQDNLREMEQRLHPSVQEFLKRSLLSADFPPPDSSGNDNFFLFLGGLAGYETLWEFTEDTNEDWLDLYVTGNDFSSTLTGITYDQSDHCCIYNGRFSENPINSPNWYRLETVLSIYIDLIERGKVVALHHDIKRPDDRLRLLNGCTISRDDHPNPPPLEDPITGARREFNRDPWVVVPYAKQDLHDTLDAWCKLVHTINDKSSEPLAEPFEGQGLYPEDVLLSAAIQRGTFAWEFFRRAPKPKIRYLGPGLRLVTATELMNNAFKSSRDSTVDLPGDRNISIPIPILLGEFEADNWTFQSSACFEDVQRVPWGLYLDVCYVDTHFPFEDGSRLVLPYALGANRIATTADGNEIAGIIPHAQLYQVGVNPFMPDHSSQLHAILNAFSRHVFFGDWGVGPQGVTEPYTVFQEADSLTAESSQSLNEWCYNVPVH